ncbi:MAG: hypothetical protein JOZ41_11680, partial [Chloroflexi bacterium]|nr:hypothetical protein [Chloroflexota bacterium]
TGPGPFGQGPWHGPGPHADGQVTAINGNTVTIKPNADRPGDTASSVTTVVLTSTTQYGAPHDSTATATRDSVKVGSFLIAEGTLSSDGKTLTASRVLVLPSLPASGTPHGAFPDWHANA